jgi:tryptophan 7-halogenase
MFPSDGMLPAEVDEFNRQTQLEMLNIRDFIILHYKATERDDSRFWRYCRDMAVPESLKHRMELFAQSGKVYKFAQELFGESSWIQVMMGQGIMPEQYHPIVNSMSDAELNDFMTTIANNAQKVVRNFPTHQEFLQYYCKSSIV